MKIVVAYCYPLVRSHTYFPLAKRFSETWVKFKPSIDHELHVICNGGNAAPIERNAFAGTNAQFHTRDNFGWDIGAFQFAAETIKPCDLLVCLGAPVHFHRAGWLDRMAEAYIENGPGLYGCWAYLSPNWHVRTTVFWTAPQLLDSYPQMVGNDRPSRYEFEHGPKSFTRHILKLGLDCFMVTWKGVFPFKDWKSNAPGVNDSLVLDQHTHR